MASRYNRRASSHRAPEPIDISEEEDYSVEEDIISEEQNNLRLRQAISYLATEGGSDSLDLYAHRVQKIDDQILQQYAAEGHLFDPKLYHQLRAMVQEVQTDISQMDADDIEMLDDSEDIEGLEQDVLLRSYDEDADDSDLGAIQRYRKEHAAELAVNAKTVKDAKAEEEAKVKADEKSKADVKAAARQKQLAIDRAGKAAVGQPPRPVRTSAPQTAQSTTQPTVRSIRPQDPVSRGHSTVDKDQKVPREIIWRYGGPKNDPEQYHQNFPASLPFGETLYMQEWESMKIDYDLKESVKKTGPVTTNINYDEVKLLAGKNPFDSGSRFKLPEEDPKTSKWMKEDKGELLRNAVYNFNQGGDLRAAEGKDYAPRIWLPKIIVGKQETFPPVRARSAPPSELRNQSASGVNKDTPPKPSTSAVKPSGSRTVGSSGTQKNVSLVHTTAPNPKSHRRILSVTGTQTRRLPASSVQDVTTTDRHKSQPPTMSDAKNLPSRKPSPGTPIVRRTESIPPQPAVKRGPGRPRKVAAPISSPIVRVIKTPRPSGATSASRGTKRKLSVGSKRFTPGKKVAFNEDDNEEFSADEGVVRKVAKEGPKSPSHTRSGRRFLPEHVQ